MLRANRSSCSPRPALAASILLLDLGDAQPGAPGDDHAVAQDLVADDLDLVALVEAVEDVAADVVDERDAAAREQERADVGVGSRDRRKQR